MGIFNKIWRLFTSHIFAAPFLTVSAKYSCGFSNHPVSPIIIVERYLDLWYKRISQSTVINQLLGYTKILYC